MVDTASLRERVLAAWAASPARFREDANAEEELVHGAYRDRLIVELAQNAADAAARAQVTGRLLLKLRGSTLVAANTGAPLDADGVEAMSTLRASAKRDDHRSVGRFGVGFSAVLAVTDEPRVSSADLGVCWSRTGALREMGRLSELADELARRGAAVPVLRLPFDAEVSLPDGYDTAVELPLRDDAGLAAVRRQLAALDDALVLALPALGEVIVDVDGEQRVMTASRPNVIGETGGLTERTVGDRVWRLATEVVRLEPEMVADRPWEERIRLERTVTIAVPVGDGKPRQLPDAVPAVIHAPTPTDDRTQLPVLVIADLPLDSTRRRVAPGAVTRHLIDRIAGAYTALVTSFRHPAALDLVPDAFGVGEVDADIRTAVLGVLGDTPFVPTILTQAETGAVIHVKPRDVVVIPYFDAASASPSMGRIVPGLPLPEWRRIQPLRQLGAREVALADFADELASVRLEPAEWREVYSALDDAPAQELGALPVPLAGGHLTRGARGLLRAGEVGHEVLSLFELRVVAPGAEHPLLDRLGAMPATPAAVLNDPRTQAAVESAIESDSDNVEPMTDAVLELVAESSLTHDDLPWLGRLELPDATGCWVPARDLVLPGSRVLDLLERPEEFALADGVAERVGPGTLLAVGVRSGVSVTRDEDVVLDEIDAGLDDVAAWRSSVIERLPESEIPPIVVEFAAVHDLGDFRDDAWGAALSMLAFDPDARTAVVGQTQVLVGDGTRRAVPSYSAWWLSVHARLGGFSLASWAAADADQIVLDLLPALPIDVDAGFAAAVGVACELRDVDTSAAIERLADPTVELDAASLSQVYAELSARDDPAAELVRVRVAEGSLTRVVEAATVVIVDTPFMLEYLLKIESGPVIVGTERLARILGLPMARDARVVGVESEGSAVPIPAAVRVLLAVLSGSDVSRVHQYIEHDELRVGAASLDWWFDGDAVHAATPEGLACGLAWTAGQWQRRHLIADLLAHPKSIDTVLLKEQFPPSQ